MRCCNMFRLSCLAITGVICTVLEGCHGRTVKSLAARGNRLCQHSPEPCAVVGHAPSIAVGDPQVGFDAAEHCGRFDELVKRDVIAKPSAVAEGVEDSSSLQVDARDEVFQIPIQLGVGAGTGVERQCELRGPFVDPGLGRDQKVHRFLVVIDSQ